MGRKRKEKQVQKKRGKGEKKEQIEREKNTRKISNTNLITFCVRVVSLFVLEENKLERGGGGGGKPCLFRCVHRQVKRRAVHLLFTVTGTLTTSYDLITSFCSLRCPPSPFYLLLFSPLLVFPSSCPLSISISSCFLFPFLLFSFCLPDSNTVSRFLYPFIVTPFRLPFVLNFPSFTVIVYLFVFHLP